MNIITPSPRGNGTFHLTYPNVNVFLVKNTRKTNSNISFLFLLWFISENNYNASWRYDIKNQLMKSMANPATASLCVCSRMCAYVLHLRFNMHAIHWNRKLVHKNDAANGNYLHYLSAAGRSYILYALVIVLLISYFTPVFCVLPAHVMNHSTATSRNFVWEDTHIHIFTQNS